MIGVVSTSFPRWQQNWLARHQHPVSRGLHAVGIPLAIAALVLAAYQLCLWRWDLWWRPVVLLALGYLLQYIGHRLEGNDVGEIILVKKLLGRPFTAISPRYALPAKERLMAGGEGTQRKTVAIIGASTDRSKYGNKSVRAHVKQGWNVYPVNPRADLIEGLRPYASLDDIPVQLDRVSLYLPPALGVKLLPAIAKAKPAEFFVNPGAESEELIEAARRLGLDPILACSIVNIGESPENV